MGYIAHLITLVLIKQHHQGYNHTSRFVKTHRCIQLEVKILHLFYNPIWGCNGSSSYGDRLQSLSMYMFLMLFSLLFTQGCFVLYAVEIGHFAIMYAWKKACPLFKKNPTNQQNLNFLALSQTWSKLN